MFLNITLDTKIHDIPKNSNPKKTHPTISAKVTLLATLTQYKKRHSPKQGIHDISGVFTTAANCPIHDGVGSFMPLFPDFCEGFPGFPGPNKLGPIWGRWDRSYGFESSFREFLLVEKTRFLAYFFLSEFQCFRTA